MKTVLITGGSRGIGAAAVEQFYRSGYRVAFGYLKSHEQAEVLKRQFPGTVALCENLLLPGGGMRLVQQAEAALGQIDVLINNAGEALPQMLFCDTNRDDWQRLAAVDLFALMETSKGVIPSMVARKSGVIINISSIWGITGGSCEVVYSAMKAGVIGFSKALAQELGPSGIRVNTVAPGFIATEMNKALSQEDIDAFAADTPLGRIGTPEEVAATLLFLASEGGSFYTGQVFSPNGGVVL